MISNEDLNRFYAGTGSRNACPTCGKNEWSVASGPDAQTDWALSSVRSDGSAVMPPPSIPALVLVCNHCFTLRAHALIGVKNWLEANPKGK